MRFFIIFALLYQTLISSEASRERDFQYLDELAIDCDSNRSSLYHNYTEIYATYLLEFREKKLKMLEIGFWNPSVSCMWDFFLPHFEYHFLDLEGMSKKGHRFEVTPFIEYSEIQYKKIALLLKEQDVIIDEGLVSEERLISHFIHFFPLLKSGGLYFIENTHTSDISEYFKYRVADLNEAAKLSGLANPKKMSDGIKTKLNTFQKEIHSISFYRGLIVIKKV